MLICRSCQQIVYTKTLGYCPACGRDSLEHIDLRCPICNKKLGEPSQIDINRLGWCCFHCNIKIYKEIYNDNK